MTQNTPPKTLLTRRLFTLTAAASALMAAPALAKPKAVTAPKDTIPARDPALSYEGRTADIAGNIVRAGFPGVVLRTHFSGPRLVLNTSASSENLYLDISIDGAAPKMVHLTKGDQALTVFDGAPGDHSVAIARRNESWEGVWDISGAATPGGHFLDAPALPAKKLMFIGDSITCGAACDVARDDPREDMTVHDAQKTYAKLIAQSLDAQCHLVSCGGRGLIRDWQGIAFSGNAPQFYELAAPDELTKPWNHASYVPDAIGIMLGTNDFNSGIPDEAEWVFTFVQFIEKIRRDAPNAPIFLIDSPIVTDGDIPKRTVLGAYLDETVRKLASPLVTRAPVKHYAGRPGNGHPIAEDHSAIAAELLPLFRKALA